MFFQPLPGRLWGREQSSPFSTVLIALIVLHLPLFLLTRLHPHPLQHKLLFSIRSTHRKLISSNKSWQLSSLYLFHTRQLIVITTCIIYHFSRAPASKPILSTIDSWYPRTAFLVLYLNLFCSTIFVWVPCFVLFFSFSFLCYVQ